MSSCSACDLEHARSRSLRPVLSTLVALSLGAALVSLLGCGDSSARSGHAADPTADEDAIGPVVLVTVSMLRPADVDAMPTLRALGEAGDWSGTAVASSSSPVVSSASLLTGVDPWIHGALAFDNARPRLGAPTLAEALDGFNEAHVPGDLGFGRYGLFAGFDLVRPFDLETVEAVLARVDDAPRFVWIHLPQPSFPLTATPDGSASDDSDTDTSTLSRTRIDDGALFAASDPEIPLDPSLRADADTLMRHEAAAADRMLARLLAALERSGWRREATVAFTALHGLELGEHDQSLFGWNLGRAVLEVPLVVDLPFVADRNGRDAIAADAPVAQQRLWPTLVEAGGGKPTPAHRPSLRHRDDSPIVSSLYARNGVNLFSAIERADGDARTDDPRTAVEIVQLTRTVRFAPAEPEYWPAVRARSGERLQLSTSPRRLFDRLQRAFRATPPFDGAETIDRPVEERLERWTDAGGVEPLDDPVLRRRLSRLLRERWASTAAPDTTPEGALRLSEEPGMR